MITVLSLNTAVDRIEVVPRFYAGRVYRAESSLACAGGKGLNVARVIRRLGEPVQVMGFLGGTSRTFIQGACSALGIEQRWITIEPETRTCMIIVDPASGAQTVVNEAGPFIETRDIDRLFAEVLRSTHEGDVLCISGSAPPGVPEGFYAEIVREMRARGIAVLVDASGVALQRCWSEHPWALAPNYEESREAFTTSGSPAEVARHLAQRVDHVLLTLGADGAIYAGENATWRVHSPHIDVINAVGSGDAFVAGFLVGMARWYAPVDAVRLGSACGASNARRLEPGIGPPEEIERLLGETSTEQV